jgi:hypothetical protein
MDRAARKKEVIKNKIWGASTGLAIWRPCLYYA